MFSTTFEVDTMDGGANTLDAQETGDAAEGGAPEEYHPQKVEDKDTSANIAQVVKENIRAWKDLDISQIEVKEVSGCGGSKTFRVSVREASGASETLADIVPAAIAFHSRSELNKPLLEERNIAAGRAFANAGIGPRLIAEDEDFRWCINAWGEKRLSKKSQGQVAGMKLLVWLQLSKT